jgi:hypothetical protein
MGCSNCGDKNAGNRHKENIPIITTTKDQGEPAKAAPSSPGEAFETARLLSYEELTDRTKASQELMDKHSEEAICNMTDHMKRFHIESLLGIYNLDITSMTGLSPNQALVGLKTTLDREDFKCVRDMYPTLKEQVDQKVEVLMQDRIILE